MPHEWHVAKAFFSADGRWLTTVTGQAGTDAADPSATALVGSTIRVWDTTSGEERTRLSLASDGGISAAVPDTSGMWLITASDAGESRDGEPAEPGTRVRAWPLAPELLRREACSHLSRNLSDSEWSTYLAQDGWRATCPGLPKVSE